MIPLEFYTENGICSNDGNDAESQTTDPENATVNRRGGSEANIKSGSRHDAQHVSICRHLGALGALPIGHGMEAATTLAPHSCVTKPATESEKSGPKRSLRDPFGLCLIEFCAGKALLAQQACTMLTQSKASASSSESISHNSSETPGVACVDVVLVDRTEVRHDAFMSMQGQSSNDQQNAPMAEGTLPTQLSAPLSPELKCTRLTVDIADLCLERLPQFQRCERSVAMGKHLCGVATDLTLRCYVRALAAAAAAVPEKSCETGHCDEHLAAATRTVDVAGGLRGGVALALCCHHLCEWDGYVDTKWLSQHGIARGEFALMKRLATKYRTHPCRQQRSHSRAGEPRLGILPPQSGRTASVSEALVDALANKDLAPRCAFVVSQGQYVAPLSWLQLREHI